VPEDEDIPRLPKVADRRLYGAVFATNPSARQGGHTDMQF